MVTIALAVAAAILLVTIHQVLLHSADSSTAARAHQIAEAIRAEGIAGVDDAMLATARDVDLIQIVDSRGRVLLSSHPHTGGALTDPLPPGAQRTIRETRAMPGGTEYRGTILGTDSADGPLTIEVGTSEHRLDSTVALVAVLCCVLFPLIVIGMAVLTYHFVGRALRPVDDVRRQVEEISGGNTHQRIPVPTTGDEIATLTRTMNAMLDRIDAARSQQIRFVNDASHELNSPLTTLVGLLDLARETRHGIDAETVRGVMMPEALRLQVMVADLLFLARADERGIPLQLNDVDLDEMVSAEVTRLEALGRLHIDARIVAVRVRGDAATLARALRNIADNAARHAVGTLTFGIDLSPSGTGVTVTVADDGPGIPDADKDRILERFVRLDESRERASGGSGLGLSIVCEIVRAHGGTVTVADAPGGGAIVGFTLPIDTADQPPPSAASR